ncbi:MAG TPA: MarR family transcriptional regulator [Coprobacillaceae bacterium]|nr:MarR family transcriptional regulator [Coprobacillaceae bacterium]
MNEEKIKCLLLINENKKITVTALAKKMNVSKATMSRMVSSFTRKGIPLNKVNVCFLKKERIILKKQKEK